MNCDTSRKPQATSRELGCGIADASERLGSTIILTVVLLAGSASAQQYVLQSHALDGGGAFVSSADYACGFGLGQPAASGLLTSTDFRAVVGFWNRPFSLVGVAEREPGSLLRPAVRQFGLGACSPNPVRRSALVQYQLSTPGRVRLEVRDRLGRRVGTIVDARQGPGVYQVTWDITSVPEQVLPDGVYYLCLVAGDRQAIAKAVVRR